MYQKKRNFYRLSIQAQDFREKKKVKINLLAEFRKESAVKEVHLVKQSAEIQHIHRKRRHSHYYPQYSYS